MKPGDAKRAAQMLEALDGIADLRRAMRRDKRSQGYERRGLELGSYDYSESGGTTDADVVVDTATGRKIVEYAEKLIRDELHRIGVDVE